MPELFLPPHVHFCCRGEAFVFLDLKQDDYTLVNGEMASALRELTMPVPLLASGSHDDALRELLQAGLLTADNRRAKRIAATAMAVAMEPLLDPETRPVVRTTMHHHFRFVTACVVAAIRLRWRTLENTVHAVAQRKSQRTHLDIDRTRELTYVFLKLRALFPRRYLCLYDSLALIEFLATYGIYPTWVFGVRLEPWAAHCWVQEGGFIFNEGVEEAAHYTPIMAI